MLQNSGFEKGIANWDGALERDLDRTQAHSGKQSLHLNRVCSVSQTVHHVLPGECKVSGYLNGTGHKGFFWYGVALSIEVRDASGKYLKSATTGNVVATDGWQSFSAAVDVPEEAASVTVILSLMNSPVHDSPKNDFYMDDLVLSGHFSSEPPVSENLLQNAGFESGLADWTQRGDRSCAFSTDAQARSGKQSAYMGYFISEPLVNYLEQTCSVSEAEGYEFSAYSKTDAGLAGVGAT